MPRRLHAAARSVIGLSKIPRLVDVFARRLQIQERMTNQIAETIREKIDPLGVAVVCEGTHLCMSMRGVEKQNSFAVTSAMLGVFRDNARTRMEFLELIKQRGRADLLPSTRRGPGLRRRLMMRSLAIILIAALAGQSLGGPDDTPRRRRPKQPPARRAPAPKPVPPMTEPAMFECP